MADQPRNGFNLLAPIYDILKHLLFGPLLAGNSRALLSELRQSRRALIVGGGTGGFLLELLRTGKVAQVTCLDISDKMLTQSQARLERHLPQALEVSEFRQADVRELDPSEQYDLICTNYFLDLFNESDLAQVHERLDRSLKPGGQWLVSDFNPEGPALFRATVLRLVYLFFRLTTGISARELPNIKERFQAQAYTEKAGRTGGGGILFSRIFTKPPP